MVRLDKERIEMKMRDPPLPPPPMPFPPRYADDPVRRSILEVAADAQRDVDRHAEMCRQYAIQGYADIEYTDPEDYDEDRMDWRPWAYLKEVGFG